MTKTKFVTAEYHEGQLAYMRGQALTTNPHLQSGEVGPLWYWVWGWQDAMADDLRNVKQVIMNATQPINRERMN